MAKKEWRITTINTLKRGLLNADDDDDDDDDDYDDDDDDNNNNNNNNNNNRALCDIRKPGISFSV